VIAPPEEGRGRVLDKRAFKELMSRLSRAGFARDFVRHAILPDWWDEECERDPALVREVFFRVARFLDLPLSVVESAEALRVPGYPNARLRRVKNVDADKLAAAIHAGMEIAAAAVRSLRNPTAVSLPSDATSWAHEVLSGERVVSLRSMVTDLWRRGVPVLHAERLPAPRFQGLACIVEGRPVILLGHRHDEPARLAVHVAHEFGHIVRGDCEAGIPVVDEEDVPDSTELEVAAEKFGWTALGAGKPVPDLTRTDDPLHLAREALALERTGPVDAGVLLWLHGNRTSNFPLAQLALKALYRNRGGRRVLGELFDAAIDIEGSSETDRALLDCVFLARKRDAPSD
jgi:hypothetical protein